MNIIANIQALAETAYERVRYGSVDHYLIVVAPQDMPEALALRKLVRKLEGYYGEPVKIQAAEKLELDGTSVQLDNGIATLLQVCKRGVIHVGNFTRQG